MTPSINQPLQEPGVARRIFFLQNKQFSPHKYCKVLQCWSITDCCFTAIKLCMVSRMTQAATFLQIIGLVTGLKKAHRRRARKIIANDIQYSDTTLFISPPCLAAWREYITNSLAISMVIPTPAKKKKKIVLSFRIYGKT